MTGLELILRTEPVSRLSRPRQRAPSVAVVYAAADGKLHLIEDGKPMKWSEALTSRFRTRYEVDLSNHVRQVVLQSSPPVAAGGVYRFAARLTVGFRVFDPRAVVRYNVRDALPVVHTYLTYVCREIAADFRIEQARGVEEAINARFRRGRSLDEGIVIYLVRASISPDADALGYLDARVRARRSNIVKREEHLVEVDDALREICLARIRQSGDLDRRQHEHMALMGRQLNAEEMVRLHLERNPQDTRQAMDLLGRANQEDFDRQERMLANDRALVEFLAEKGLVRPADIARLRDRAASRLFQPPRQFTPTSAGSWDDPVPPPTAPDSTATVPGLIPVYVLLDTSSGASIQDLQAAIRALDEALAGQPQVAEAVRLSIFGIADDVHVVRSLDVVDERTKTPSLRGGGQLLVGKAFGRLARCIPDDVTKLRALNTSVRRPQVIVLIGGQPADGTAWHKEHDRLTDRDTRRTAPDILAFGVGQAGSATVARMATRPEYAFMAITADLAQAIQDFGAFLGPHVVRYGRAVIDGDLSPRFVPPAGFRRADDS